MADGNETKVPGASVGTKEAIGLGNAIDGVLRRGEESIAFNNYLLEANKLRDVDNTAREDSTIWPHVWHHQVETEKKTKAETNEQKDDTSQLHDWHYKLTVEE